MPASHATGELQILVHGANSDHRYWDFPVEPELYSYVAWAAARGIATLAIDRIGSGWSSHPAGSEVTIEAQADALRQIVGLVRAGLPGVRPVRRVVVVGASLGSVVSGTMAAAFGGIDALVLTAYLPADGDPAIGSELFDVAFGPAADGMTRLRGLVDDDYLVPRLEGGGAWLYHANSADPAVIATEDAMAGTTTRAELSGAISAGPMIRQSVVPTLVLVGQYDPLMYDSAAEPDASAAIARVAELTPANFEYRMVPDTGHTLNLHRTAHTTYEIIHRWLS
jgi:hypothetical protein